LISEGWGEGEGVVEATVVQHIVTTIVFLLEFGCIYIEVFRILYNRWVVYIHSTCLIKITVVPTMNPFTAVNQRVVPINHGPPRNVIIKRGVSHPTDDRVAMVRTDATGGMVKTEKTEKTARMEETDAMEKTGVMARMAKMVKTAKTDVMDAMAKMVRTVKMARTVKTGGTVGTEKTDATAKTEKTDAMDMMDATAVTDFLDLLDRLDRAGIAANPDPRGPWVRRAQTDEMDLRARRVPPAHQDR